MAGRARGMSVATSAQGDGTSILIVGYGNISRRDDGVAFHIVERLKGRLVPSTLAEASVLRPEMDMDSEIIILDGLRARFVHQLAPELAELLAAHDLVVFVDAHVAEAGWDPVHWQEVQPAFQSSLVGHHLKPSSVVALAEALYGRRPRAYVLSVLGVDFDFGEGLSAQASAGADQAVERLLALVSPGVES